MKKITVYADFDFLASSQEIGTLGYERVRGKDHFVFEYSHEWLKQHGGIVLSGDLMNVPSLQHPRGADSVFGFVKDSFPDRWGRLLLDRRERLKAQAEGRPVQMLTNYDYLTGIEDFTRMGGIRYKVRTPKITSIRAQSTLFLPLRVFVPCAMLVTRSSWPKNVTSCRNSVGSTN